MWLFLPQLISLETASQTDPGVCLLVQSRPCEANNINPVHEQMTISQFLQLLPSQGNHITMPVWVVEIVGWEFIISLFHLMEKKKPLIQKCAVSHHFPY